LKHILIIIAILLFNLTADAKPFNILVIHSYQQEFPQTKMQHNGFIKGLQGNTDGHLFNIYVEYLNGKSSITALENTAIIDKFMQSKYLLNKPDLIYATNDEAIYYLSKTSLGYFKDIPLIISGVSQKPDIARTGLLGGLVTHHEIPKTIAMINSIFPNQPSIVFLDSGSKSTWNINDSIERYLKTSKTTQYIRLVVNRDIEKLIASVKGDENTIFILMHGGGFINGNRHETLIDGVRMLKEKLPSKYLFNLHELEIMEGALGGYVASEYDQGVKCGKLAIQILNGSPPPNLIQDAENAYVFDRKALDNANIELPAAIVSKTRFINEYPTFMELYGRTLIWVIIILVLIILLSSTAFSLYTYNQHKQLKEITIKLVEAKRNTEQYMEAVDASNLVAIMDTSGHIKYINDQYVITTGYTRDEILGKTHRFLNHPETDKTFYASIIRTVTSGEMWIGILRNSTKYGDLLFLETSIVPIKNNMGEITEYLSISKDITQVIAQQREINDQYTDILTGLPNRVRMRLDRNKAENPAVAILNIDRFGVINTFYGMEAGDHLLKLFAEKLKSLVESCMQVYRLSGDEFGILATEVVEFDRFNNFILDIIHKISASSFIYQESEMHLSVTAGTSFGKETTIVKAGMALRHAREKKKNLMTYQDVESDMIKIRETVHYSSSLRNALTNGNIIPYFQPLADTKTGKIVKHEALMRIADTDGSILPPISFLYLSKQLKLYDALSMMMMEKTIEVLLQKDIDTCINFDIEDILNIKYQERFFELINKHNLQGRMTIEITESEGIDNLDELAAFVTKAKQNGCLIAIDDFGTGYSNFMYILSLQPDFLKIDGSITRQILVSSRARLLVRTITQMCKHAGIKTVAEYVSNEEIYAAIQELGIDYCQGYLFGKPAPTSEIQT